jgi:diacylglycerol kinase (ATP)
VRDPGSWGGGVDEPTGIARHCRGKRVGVRLALVVNEGSGGGTDAAALEAALREAGAEVETSPFDALDDLTLEGIDRLVIAAGDGGVGLAAARAARADVQLAVIASGTANDFAGFLDLPDDPEDAAALAADPGARVRPIDIGLAGRIPFVNAAACGLSVAAAEAAVPLKATMGATAYAIGAVRAGVSEAACAYRVLVDGSEVHDGLAWQIIVSGTGAFGNGSEVESADPGDGLFDVTVLHGSSRAALPLRAWGMRRGGLHEQEGVTSFRGREVVVEGAEAWNIDGEHCEQPDAGTFRLDGRVGVVVP